MSNLWSLSPSEYIVLLNITTGKILAVFLVLCFGTYHGLLRTWSDGVTPCKGLLVDGMYKGDFWQPWGCMMHRYSVTDSERCFRYNGFYSKQNHFVFIGDSRIRQLYMTMQAYLTSKELDDEIIPYHQDMSWRSPQLNLKLEFFWAPVLNGTMNQVLSRWKAGSSPNLIIIGAGTHTIKSSNDSMEALREFKQNLTSLRPQLEALATSGQTTVWWLMQPTVNVATLHPARRAVSPSAIVRYNEVTLDVLKKLPSITLWSSIQTLVQDRLDDMIDGIHFPKNALHQAILMILNKHCNDKMNFNDGTCCKSSDSPTNLQFFTFAFFFLCALLYTLDIFYRQFCSSNRSNTMSHGGTNKSGAPVSLVHHFYLFLTQSASRNPILPKSAENTAASVEDMRTFLRAITRLGVIVAYFYVCDRTNFFMKESKYFTPLNFWLPVLYVFILGLFFHEESKGTKFLHREQTDEWKGWMQLVILIYHMTGASQALPIYMHIRVFVTAYVFLNAYGHFFYVWLKGSTSLERFLQILFRMNFLTFVLCLAMNRPYQAYYFVPLISFWFSFQYLIMAIPPKITAGTSETSPKHYFYLILKVMTMLAIVSIFYMSEVFFEKIFLTRPWKALFVTTDDEIKEWWFRWRLDRYSMIYGFIFAFLVAIGQRFKLFDDNLNGSLWPKALSWPISVFSVMGLGGYFLFAWNCKRKQDCNEIHSYISFVPILSFIMLRNMYGFIRTRYSSFFAWFGRFSLELFISQYHIWLAADTHGVLVLIPNYPLMNILLTSFIFICAAHEINIITGILVPYFVPKEKKYMARNFIIFLIVMIPIGIHDGMI